MDIFNISPALTDIEVLKDRSCGHTSINQVKHKTNLFIQQIFTEDLLWPDIVLS